jgi:hypothetical protein
MTDAIIQANNASGRGTNTDSHFYTAANSVLSSVSKSLVGESKQVKTILGLEGRDRGSITAPTQLPDGTVLTSAQQKLVAEIYKVAQINGENYGKDLKAILPDLLKRVPDIKNPGKEVTLLELLHSVATTDKFFAGQGFERKVSPERRAEFLVEKITEAADRKMLNQGHSLMCTVTKQFSNTTTENILRVSCDLALYGKTTSSSGRPIVLGSGTEGPDKLIAWAEKKSGHALNDSGAGTIGLNQIAARQPGAMSTLILASLMELNVSDVTKNVGQTWDQFARSWQTQSGFASVCAAYDAKIAVDANGKPIWCHNEDGSLKDIKSRSVTPVEYIDLTLNRGEKEPRGVLVNMRWADAKPVAGRESEHSCHTVSVVGTETHLDGKWYVIENPVGGYMEKGPDGKPRRFAEGTALGNMGATWWKEGKDGLVYVRADVFKDSLIHVMVDHKDRKIDESNGPAKIFSIGSVNGTADSVLYDVHVTETHEVKLAEQEADQKRDDYEVAKKKEQTEQEEEIRAKKRELADEQFRAALATRQVGLSESDPVARFKRDDDERDKTHKKIVNEDNELPVATRPLIKPTDLGDRKSILGTFPQVQVAQSATPPPPPPGAPPSRDA